MKKMNLSFVLFIIFKGLTYAGLYVGAFAILILSMRGKPSGSTIFDALIFFVALAGFFGITQLLPYIAAWKLATPQKKITVKQRKDGCKDAYKAVCVDGDGHPIYGLGNSITEAVGELVCAFSYAFNVSVDVEEEKQK